MVTQMVINQTLACALDRSITAIATIATIAVRVGKLTGDFSGKIAGGSTIAAIAAFATSTLSLTLSFAQPLQAQAAYGSYIGVGSSLGMGDDTELAGVVAFRYKLLELPISLRAQAMIGDGFALVPTVSYDIPLSWQTDLHVGVGVSLAGEDSVLGDRTAFALQSGVDHMFVNNNLAIFGNAILAFDAYRDRGAAALAIQGGVGLQF